MLNIGIDLGVTSKHKAQIRDEKGTKVRHDFSFSTSAEELDTLFGHALKDSPEGTKLRLILEPTEMSWFPVTVYGKSQGHQVVRVKSQKAHQLREYYKKYGKSNKLDAKALAMVPVVDGEDSLEEVFLPDAKAFALDRRCRQRERITREIARVKNRISSLFHWLCPGLMDCFADKYGEVAIAFYRRYANPFKAKKLGLEGITRFFNRLGNRDSELAQRVYQAVLGACALYEGAGEWVDFDQLQDELTEELRLLAQRQKAQARVNAQIKRLYKQVHPSGNIETIPGIGEVLGSTLMGIIADPGRFHSEVKARGYIGFCPRQDDSGEGSKKGLPATKEGPPRFRWATYMAGDTARQWDPQMAKIYYEQMVYKGNSHTQAVCAVGTHLVGRILAVLKEDRPYQLRDPEGRPISKKEAKELIRERFTVPQEVRDRTRTRRSRRKKRRRRRRTYR